MITGLNHASFTVVDMDRSVHFWTTAIGFEARSVSPRHGAWQSKVTGVEGAELMVAHLYGYGTHIELIQYLSGAGRAEAMPPNHACAAHVCFDVTDIETTWSALLAAGAVPQGAITLVDNGPVRGIKAGYLRDPNGIVIELEETPLTR